MFNLLEVETTNFCNRRCWYCIRQPGPRRYMSNELIDKVIAELHDLQYSGLLNWFSANEPLMDDRIEQIIRKTKRAVPWCRIRLFTNGDFLTQERFDLLFSCGLNELKISCHDAQAEVKAACLDKGSQNVRVAVYHDKVHLWNRAGVVTRILYNGGRRNLRCTRPSRNMVIRYDGQLKLCAEDLLGTALPTCDRLNAQHRSLSELWESVELTYYRTQLKKGNRTNMKPCHNCNFKQP